MKSPKITLLLGDTVERLQQMPESSMAAFVVDPPYGLEFMGKEWDRLDVPENWQNTTGFSLPGIGDRATGWPSFSSTSQFGAVNPTCEVCGGRLRGAKKCSCPQPHDHWKPIGKRRKLPDDTPSDVTGGGMLDHLHKMQAWHTVWLAEVYRVLRPGGIIKAFSATRTMHRLTAAMRSVGFEIVRLEAWLYGSGFPKSLNVAKAIDKAQGFDPEVGSEIQTYLRLCRETRGLSKSEVDQRVFGGTTRYSWAEGRGGERADEVYLPTPEEWDRLKAVLGMDDRYDEYIRTAIPSRENRALADGGKAEVIEQRPGDWGFQPDGDRWDGTQRVTRPTSPEAIRFDGYGTALKPAWEPFIVGRKPG